jgi:hypothetical protein
VRFALLLARDEARWGRAADGATEHHPIDGLGGDPGAGAAGGAPPHAAFEAAVRGAGGTVDCSEVLRSVVAATTYRRRGTEELITDGPPAQLAEQLAGFYVVDLPDLDAVVAAVRHLPEYTVEIRPVEGR